METSTRPVRNRLSTARTHVRRARRSQRGAGTLGFLATALPTLLVGLGGVEIAHWMQVRQTLSLALLEAARAGTTRHAQPEAIAQSFEHALRALYPQPESLAKALDSRRRHLGVPWHIRIVHPAPDDFLDHGDPRLRARGVAATRALIHNDHQMLRHRQRIAEGWRQGRGPHSGASILQANTLQMALIWPQRPLTPAAEGAVRMLAAFVPDKNIARLMRAGYLPFRRHIAAAMQSHPAAWPALADGRITYANPTIEPTAVSGATRSPHAPPPDTGTAAPPADGRVPPGTAPPDIAGAAPEKPESGVPDPAPGVPESATGHPESVGNRISEPSMPGDVPLADCEPDF